MTMALRAAIVGLFLFVLHASAAAQVTPTCSEYSCKINTGGSGYYCIQEGTIDCICNSFGCVCGECVCIDGGDCYLMPWQG